MPCRAPPATTTRDRLRPLVPIVVFDTVGPFVVYTLLRNSGSSEVMSLIISGIPPALGVLLAIVRQRRLDVIGALVLIGLAIAIGLGLVSGNAKLVLLEGSVPTVLFAVACLGSLLTPRPLMFRFAYEFHGHDTPAGRDFNHRWQYAGFRHAFRVITVVWGIGFLAEAAVRIVIVETQSVGTALSISKALPYVVAAMLVAWMIAYGRRSRRKAGPAAQRPLGG